MYGVSVKITKCTKLNVNKEYYIKFESAYNGSF